MPRPGACLPLHRRRCVCGGFAVNFSSNNRGGDFVRGRGSVEVIMTDESAIYPWALDKIQKKKHRTICHSKEYAAGDIHTNTVESAFSLLKRGIVGTWHKVSAKHLPAYLDEMCFRFNNRKNPYLFRDTILKLIASPNVEYKELTAKQQDAA